MVRGSDVIVGCCCLMLVQSAMAEPEPPSKPAKIEKKPAPDHRTALTSDTPKPANPLDQLTAAKPKASHAATRTVVFPGGNLGLGCAKDE